MGVAVGIGVRVKHYIIGTRVPIKHEKSSVFIIGTPSWDIGFLITQLVLTYLIGTLKIRQNVCKFWYIFQVFECKNADYLDKNLNVPIKLIFS